MSCTHKNFKSFQKFFACLNSFKQNVNQFVKIALSKISYTIILFKVSKTILIRLKYFCYQDHAQRSLDCMGIVDVAYWNQFMDPLPPIFVPSVFVLIYVLTLNLLTYFIFSRQNGSYTYTLCNGILSIYFI